MDKFNKLKINPIVERNILKGLIAKWEAARDDLPGRLYKILLHPIITIKSMKTRFGLCKRVKIRRVMEISGTYHLMGRATKKRIWIKPSLHMS